MKPLLLLHGLMDAPCTWDLVRPYLERDRKLLTPALPGHLGGPLLADVGGPLSVVGYLNLLRNYI